MIFTSFKFLLFIAAVFIGYFIFPKRYRWVWLLLSSGYFYLCTGVKYAVFLVMSALSAYLFGMYCRSIARKRDSFLSGEHEKDEIKAYKKRSERRKKRAVALVIVFNLAILGYLKYADFLLENISHVVQTFAPSFQFTGLELVLPLGISFYTFMVIGYCIDIYREVSEGERNPLRLLLFLSFFPHIMQGPIDRYENLAPQLYEGHSFDFRRMTDGLCRMVWGFFEKLIIADRLAILVDTVFGSAESYSGCYLIIAIFCYAIQIYADFAGYMDIALGASKVLGIYPAENFDTPYLASSVPEFWRRWHITLGSFFRDYLFYPVLRSSLCKRITKSLKGKVSKNTSGMLTTCLALAVVWFMTGLWHGASWHYIAWGVYYGILIILSTVTKPLTERVSCALHINRESSDWRLFCIAKTFLLVLVGYVFFRADDTAHALLILKRTVSAFMPSHNAPGASLGLDVYDIMVAVFGILVLLCVDLLKYHKVSVTERFHALPLVIRWTALYAAIAIILVFGIYGPGYDSSSFIYFAF